MKIFIYIKNHSPVREVSIISLMYQLDCHIKDSSELICAVLQALIADGFKSALMTNKIGVLIEYQATQLEAQMADASRLLLVPSYVNLTFTSTKRDRGAWFQKFRAEFNHKRILLCGTVEEEIDEVFWNSIE